LFVQAVACEKAHDHEVGDGWRHNAVNQRHYNWPNQNAAHNAQRPALPRLSCIPKCLQPLRDCELHQFDFIVTDGRHNTGFLQLAPPAKIGFEQALALAASQTDAALDILLPEIAGDRLRCAMRYAVLAQGKRLRPFFVLESARLHDVDFNKALAVAAALECIHCYSLVHDDLPAMDNDDLRRGQPTTHKKFDEATAILAGDGLLTVAFEIAADAGPQTIKALAKAAGPFGMVGGQMLDIEAETLGFKSIAEISNMQRMKTGALFDFACAAGPMLAGADTGALLCYSHAIGLAFQIADDVLDVEASPEMMGKATQKDKGKGKATFVDLLGLDGAKAEAQKLVAEAISALEPYGDKADILREAARFMVNRQK
jgi:farnesyl diphosphate synthase